MDALPCPDIKDGPWTLVFQDGQDFCNHASKIIGAVYVSPADAAARIARTGSFGTTFGKVGATGPTPLDAESIAGQYMVELALAEYRDDPTPVMAEAVVRRVLEAQASSAPARAWPRATSVGRLGDMAPAGDTHMRVILDGDNDVCIAIYDNTKGRGANASIEFCAGARWRRQVAEHARRAHSADGRDRGRRRRDATRQLSTEGLVMNTEPRADEDGHCTRCGLSFEDPRELAHECPLGFIDQAAQPRAVPPVTGACSVCYGSGVGVDGKACPFAPHANAMKTTTPLTGNR